MNTENPAATEPKIYDERDRLVLLLPCYDWQMTAPFAEGLAEARQRPQALFRLKDGTVQQLPILADYITLKNESHIDRARNTLLHLYETKSSRWRFPVYCDVDQELFPEHLARIWIHLTAGHPVVGGLVAAKSITPTFVCNIIPGVDVDPVTGLRPVKHIGTGLIGFDAERVLGAFRAAARLDYVCGAGNPWSGETLHAYFASGIVTEADGRRDWLSEDWMLCHRCTQLGIPLVVDTLVRLRHLGRMLFPPPAEDVLEAALAIVSGSKPPMGPALAEPIRAALSAYFRDQRDDRISVLHATRGRPEQALAIRAEWIAKAFAPDGFEYILAIDEDDDVSRQAFLAAGVEFKVSRAPGAGIVAAINKAAARAKGRILAMAADDCHPPQHWDREIRACLKGRLHEPLVLATSDGYSRQFLIPHPIMTRAFYEAQGGYFFCPEYKHLFCDTELTVRAQAAGRVVDGMHLVFRHDNPMFTGEKADALAEARNSKEAWAEGREVFRRRNADSNHPHAKS